MESLLIVDDEVIIADGLYHMLQEVFQDRLEVRRCYSCDEACAVMNRNRVKCPERRGWSFTAWCANAGR